MLLGARQRRRPPQLRDDYVSGLDWNLLHFTTVRGLRRARCSPTPPPSATCDDYGFSKERVFYDVGYSFRVLHDAFGVYQQLLSIDLGIPLNPRPPSGTCLGHPPDAGVADLHRAGHVLP